MQQLTVFALMEEMNRPPAPQIPAGTRVVWGLQFGPKWAYETTTAGVQWMSFGDGGGDWFLLINERLGDGRFLPGRNCFDDQGVVWDFVR